MYWPGLALALSVSKKQNKNGTFAKEKNGALDPQTDIYSESVSPEECHKHIHMVTPLSIFKKKKPNGTLVRKKNGTTGLQNWHADITWLCE